MVRPGYAVEYDYVDVVLNQAYGMVSSVDVPQERSSDARWTVSANGWAAPAAHEGGRRPYLGVLLEGREGDDTYWVSFGELRANGGSD